MRFSLTLSLQFSTAVLASLISLEDSLLLLNFGEIDVFQSRLQVPIMSPESSVGLPLAPLHCPDDEVGVAPWHFFVILKNELTPSQVSSFKSEVLLMYAAFTAKMQVKPEMPEFFSIHTLNGFGAFLSPLLLHEIRSDPRVLFVQNQATAYLADSSHPQNFQSLPRNLHKSYLHTLDIQEDATWGLDRISHRVNSKPNPLQYLHDPQGGAGVNVYVVDSGIDTLHTEFEGRARWGFSTTSPYVDVHGHGTHIAGIIGSLTYGVSKKVNLIAVGVVNSGGTVPPTDLIEGIKWAIADHKANVHKDGFKGLVINISLRKKKDPAMDALVDAAVAAGLHVAVGAGNENKDACDFSPRSSNAITVGETTPDDTVAALSNWGMCVDVFAPGIDIMSTYIGPATKLMSGTLMASGFVSGLMAYFLSLAPADANVDPASFKQRFLRFGTKFKLKGLGDEGSPNLLAFNGGGADLADFWRN